MTDPNVEPTVDPNAPSDPPAAPVDPATATPSEKDWKAEAEKYKAHARTWETRAKENQSAAEKVAELEAANLTDLEKAQRERDAAVTRAAEIEKTSRTRVLNSAVREMAASEAFRFHDPANALAMLSYEGKLDTVELDSAGEFDRTALQGVLADLATRNPHLVAASTAPRAPQPDTSQGPRQVSLSAAEEAEYQSYFPKRK